MTICHECQTQNDDRAAFCVGCGRALSGRARPSAAPGSTPSKGMAIASLVLGIVGVPTAGCLLVGAATAIVLGAIALKRANSRPAEYGGRGMAIAGMVLGGVSFVMVPVMGIIAAIAIPSFLRARVSANEAAVIGDTRTVISAEAAYQAVNGGYYDTLACLGAPALCLPRYTGKVAMLDATLARDPLTKSGYHRTLHLGAGPETADAEGISPSSVRAFAYVSVPVTPGQTGVRAFCGDSTGRVCSWSDGNATAIEDGVCPEDCNSLR